MPWHRCWLPNTKGATGSSTHSRMEASGWHRVGTPYTTSAVRMATKASSVPPVLDSPRHCMHIRISALVAMRLRTCVAAIPPRPRVHVWPPRGTVDPACNRLIFAMQLRRLGQAMGAAIGLAEKLRLDQSWGSLGGRCAGRSRGFWHGSFGAESAGKCGGANLESWKPGNLRTCQPGPTVCPYRFPEFQVFRFSDAALAAGGGRKPAKLRTCEYLGVWRARRGRSAACGGANLQNWKPGKLRWAPGRFPGFQVFRTSGFRRAAGFQFLGHLGHSGACGAGELPRLLPGSVYLGMLRRSAA